MKKIVRLTESDLRRIVKRVLKESETGPGEEEKITTSNQNGNLSPSKLDYVINPKGKKTNILLIMKNLVVGNTSQLFPYFQKQDKNILGVSSRSFNYEDLKPNNYIISRQSKGSTNYDICANFDKSFANSLKTKSLLVSEKPLSPEINLALAKFN